MIDLSGFDLSDDEQWDELCQAQQWDLIHDIIKSTVTVPEVAEMLGFEIDSRDKITSPWNPDERTPSCHLYDDHFYDYSTGRWGDLYDLVQAVQPGITTGQIANMLRRKALAAGKEAGDVEQAQPRQLQNFTDQLPTTPYVDLFELQICRSFDCRIDLEGNVLVPHRDQDGVYGVKVRFARGGKGSWAGSQFTHRLYDPFGWAPGHFPGRDVVICEGESDCWALTSVLYPEHADVLALPSGAGTWRDHWLADLGCYDRVFICMDNDKAGRDARDKLMLKVGYSRAERLDVPSLYNDAREAIKAGWVPSL